MHWKISTRCVSGADNAGLEETDHTDLWSESVTPLQWAGPWARQALPGSPTGEHGKPPLAGPQAGAQCLVRSLGGPFYLRNLPMSR